MRVISKCFYVCFSCLLNKYFLQYYILCMLKIMKCIECERFLFYIKTHIWLRNRILFADSLLCVSICLCDLHSHALYSRLYGDNLCISLYLLLNINYVDALVPAEKSYRVSIYLNRISLHLASDKLRANLECKIISIMAWIWKFYFYFTVSFYISTVPKFRKRFGMHVSFWFWIIHLILTVNVPADQIYLQLRHSGIKWRRNYVCIRLAQLRN